MKRRDVLVACSVFQVGQQFERLQELQERRFHENTPGRFLASSGANLFKPPGGHTKVPFLAVEQKVQKVPLENRPVSGLPHRALEARAHFGGFPSARRIRRLLRSAAKTRVDQTPRLGNNPLESVQGARANFSERNTTTAGGSFEAAR